jgi:NTE family protein
MTAQAAREPRPPPRVGLVLGAGGVVGQAYHSGVLAALEHDLGWDPRRAEVVVGTSAGAVTGAALRAGVSAEDLAAWCVDAPLWGPTAELAARAGARPQLAPLRPLALLRPGHLPGVPLFLRSLKAPWRIRPATIAATLLHDGTIDIERQVTLLGALPEAWPDYELWVCTVRRSNGRRAVFGREGAPAASLRSAVAASCAVPGYFRPVRIGNHDYIDGGTHSPTNADALRRHDLDLVVVVAPMSGARSGWSIDGEMRRRASRQMRAEIATLRVTGHEVLTIEPSAAVIEAMGTDVMDDDVVRHVVREAFLDTGKQLRTLDMATRDLLTVCREHAIDSAER